LKLKKKYEEKIKKNGAGEIIYNRYNKEGYG